VPRVLADIVYLDTCQAALLTFVAVKNGSRSVIELEIKLNRLPNSASIFIGVCVGAIALLSCGNKMPTDQELIQRFKNNKGAFQNLKERIGGDPGIGEVMDSGVQMSDSPTFVLQPTNRISGEKFKEYLDLLYATGGSRVSRSEGPTPDVCVGMWADGGLGDARHKSICWIVAPASGHDYINSKLVDDHWYLERDFKDKD
jgi:hypothetical protein